MTTLYRPVGLNELGLIWDSGCHQFPPRLPEQPIFYPATSNEYAIQIARDWNTKSSSYAGYVTAFEVDDAYLSKFERHVVGSAVHEEYWIPANELPEFNRAIQGVIYVRSAFFGDSFVGFIPESGGLRAKNAEQQFVVLSRNLAYGAMDFSLEISLNRKAIYLNCLFWIKHEFTACALDPSVKSATLAGVIEVWKHRGIQPGLPVGFMEMMAGL